VYFFFFSKINIQRQIHTQLVIQGGSFINQIKLEDENKTNISSEYRDWSRLPFLFCFVLIYKTTKHQINNHL
jgi:hypothetical protein